MRLRVQLLHPAAVPPVRYHVGDAGLDLAIVEDAVLWPGEPQDLPSGIAIEPDPGWWFSIEHRSSTPRRGIDVVQGTIDNGFRGELFTRVINRTDAVIEVRAGERLAQIIPHSVYPVSVDVVEDLAGSSRGTNGFGSTGVLIDVPTGVAKENRDIRTPG